MTVAKYVIGNWKMNGDYALVMQMIAALRSMGPLDNVTTVICPPFTLLHSFAELLGMGHIHLGAQDCGTEISGARTGDISAAMLIEQNCRYAIVGHSERRRYQMESNEVVAAKAANAQAAGLMPVICVGENLAEREEEQAEIIVEEQVTAVLKKLKNAAVIFAYEPVWAIGTGQVASHSDIAGMHDVIRARAAKHDFKDVAVLYGGSVKPENAGGILALGGVDGVLLGGASIDPDAFIAIAKTAHHLP
ncbi:MAG TPA: triose-phosphate isomerase [Alphaproteobacteria bacterium]|nr:triose-phosphate isomerase [Rhodospirillaceae bacterium]HRJ12426.1 triose-phosphate isomerase [Alphaproteobacteria bacterium]